MKKKTIIIYIIVFILTLIFGVAIGYFGYEYFMTKNDNEIQNVVNKVNDVNDNNVTKETQDEEVINNYKIVTNSVDCQFYSEEYLFYKNDSLINIKNIYYYTHIFENTYVYSFDFDNYSTSIYNIDTNQLVRTISGVATSGLTSDQDEIKFFALVPQTISVSRQIWSPNLENNEIYHNQTEHVLNNNQTITVVNNNNFTIIDFNGEVIQDKKTFDKIFDIAQDYLLVQEDNNLVLVKYDLSNKTIVGQVSSYSTYSIISTNDEIMIEKGDETMAVYNIAENKLNLVE